MKLECPTTPDNYNLLEVDGYNIYVKNNITAKNDTLYIKYKKILFAGKLIVEGIVF